MNRPPPKWFRPEATLDLHRLTVAEAEEALETFLHASFRAKKRTLLVIHGAKTLSNVVRRLLDSHSLVTGHEPDNTGATRVFLGKHP
ncbi:MAG: Smr/MutS family protein [Fibrobacteres bacterium]|nr:Smr/MutS family protein [Fibrobacterota bacterium]